MTFSVIAGQLPPGLELDCYTGIISGPTPSQVAWPPPVSNSAYISIDPLLYSVTYDFVVEVNDGVDVTDQSYSIKVFHPNEPPVWQSPAAGQVFSANAGTTLAAIPFIAYDPEGGPVTYSIASTTYPTSYTFANGVVTLPAFPANEGGEWSFTAAASDMYGATSTVTFNVQAVRTFQGPQWSTPAGSLGNFLNNQSISIQLGASDPDNDPFTFVDPNNQLPAGLSLSSSGVISGSNITVGTYTFTLRVQDATFGQYYSDRQFSVLVAQAYQSPYWITPAGSLGTGTVGSNFSYQLQGTSPVGNPLTYSSGDLPNYIGLSSSGLLTGTYTSPPGTYNFTVVLSDGTTNVPQNFSIDSGNLPYQSPVWDTASGVIASQQGGVNPNSATSTKQYDWGNVLGINRNLLNNGDASNGTNGWRQSGSGVLQQASSGGPNNLPYFYATDNGIWTNWLSVTAGNNYSFQGWINSQGISSGFVRIILEWMNETRNQTLGTTTNIGFLPPGVGWTQFTLAGQTAPAGASLANILIDTCATNGTEQQATMTGQVGWAQIKAEVGNNCTPLVAEVSDSVPANYQNLFVEWLIGGGGSGGGSTETDSGGGGGGGGSGGYYQNQTVGVNGGDAINIFIGMGAPQNTSAGANDPTPTAFRGAGVNGYDSFITVNGHEVLRATGGGGGAAQTNDTHSGTDTPAAGGAGGSPNGAAGSAGSIGSGDSSSGTGGAGATGPNGGQGGAGGSEGGGDFASGPSAGSPASGYGSGGGGAGFKDRASNTNNWCGGNGENGYVEYYYLQNNYLSIQLAAHSPQGTPLTYSIASGSLPPGVSMSGSGDITGYVGTGAVGTYKFTVSANDGTSSTNRDFEIDITS